MPKYYSPNWDMEHGLCIKHDTSKVPCPECITTRDKDVIVLTSVNTSESSSE